MKCIISGDETNNKWRNMVISKEVIEVAKEDRDEKNEKIMSDHIKSLTGHKLETKMEVHFITLRGVLQSMFEKEQNRISTALKKAIGMNKDKLNKFA